jgi:hypothetical protein
MPAPKPSREPKKKIHVALTGSTGCGLIVPQPTGIVYGNQTSLPEGEWRELEGYYVPLDYDRFGGRADEIMDDPAALDALLLRYTNGSPYTVAVSRRLFRWSRQAWLWVELTGDLIYVDGEVPKAVLTR